MKAKLLLPVLVLCLAIGVVVSGCGDDDGDDTGAATVTETEAPADVTEPGDDSADGGSAPAPSGDAARSEKVEIVDFAYEPDPVTVEEGGKVTWINRDSDPHTCLLYTSPSPRDGLLSRMP